MRVGLVEYIFQSLTRGFEPNTETTCGLIETGAVNETADQLCLGIRQSEDFAERRCVR